MAVRTTTLHRGPAIAERSQPSAPTVWESIRKHFWSYAFLAPAILLIALFVVYPLVASIQVTLYDWNGIGNPTRYVGMQHFYSVAADPLFWNAFAHTFTYMAVLVPVQLLLALVLALVLNNPRLRGSTIYRAIYFSPVVTSAALIGIVMSMLLSSVGTRVSDALLEAGLIAQPLDLLGDPRFALAAVIFVGIWHTLGYNLVYFLAGLQSIPRDVYEAADVDGAGAFVKFFKVTVPMLRGVGAIILFLAILGSLQVFDLVLVMTGGGPYFSSEVVSTYIYHYAFTPASVAAESNVGYASAAALFMGVIVMGFTLIQLVVARYIRQQGTSKA